MKQQNTGKVDYQYHEHKEKFSVFTHFCKYNFSPSLPKVHVLHSVMIEENLMKRLLENLSLMKFLENDLDLENDSYMVSSKISIHGDTLVK